MELEDRSSVTYHHYSASLLSLGDAMDMDFLFDFFILFAEATIPSQYCFEIGYFSTG